MQFAILIPFHDFVPKGVMLWSQSGNRLS